MSEQQKELFLRIERCRSCKTINGYQKFPGDSHGNLNSHVMLVSEAPGKDSLAQKKYWVGAGGRILRDCLPDDIQLEDLFYLTDIVKCWPESSGSNRKPNEDEIGHCFGYLRQEIEILKPELILSFGGVSSSALLNGDLSIVKNHGVIHEYNRETKVITLLHPSGIDRFMRRDKYKKQLGRLFEKIKNNDFNNISDIFQETYKKESQSITYRKLNTVNVRSGLKDTFIIPSAGNSITAKDTSKKQLRITADFKRFFPRESSEIDVEYKQKQYRLRFICRETRSHIIKLGTLADALQLKPGMQISFSVLGSKKYRIN